MSCRSLPTCLIFPFWFRRRLKSVSTPPTTVSPFFKGDDDCCLVLEISLHRSALTNGSDRTYLRILYE